MLAISAGQPSLGQIDRLYARSELDHRHLLRCARPTTNHFHSRILTLQDSNCWRRQGPECQHMTFGMLLGLLQVWWTGRVQDQCARSRPNKNPTTLASVAQHGSMHFADGPSQITCTGPLSVNGDGHPPWSWAYFNREVREGSLSLVLFAEQRQCDKSCPKMSVTWTSLTTWD